MAHVVDVEERIFELEEIRVVLRASKSVEVKSYNYKRKASGDMEIGLWIKERILPLIGDIEVVVIRGNGQTMVHPKTNLEEIRSTYNLNK